MQIDHLVAPVDFRAEFPGQRPPSSSGRYLQVHGDEDVNFIWKGEQLLPRIKSLRGRSSAAFTVSSFDLVACPALVLRTGSSSSLGLIVFAVLGFH